MSIGPFTKQRAFASTGRHQAVLHDITEVAGNFGRPALQFVWYTDDGCQIRQTTGTTAAKGTSLGDLLDQLVGSEVPVDGKVEPLDLIGKRYEILVVAHDEMTKIAAIKLLPDDEIGALLAAVEELD